jgi:hypothetical protein
MNEETNKPIKNRPTAADCHTQTQELARGLALPSTYESRRRQIGKKEEEEKKKNMFFPRFLLSSSVRG